MTTGEGISEARQAAAGVVVRTQDVVAGTWKNGAGLTREIAARTTPGAMDGFDWRISVADLMRDASFSTFPGVDRTFLIASGSGVVLHLDGSAVPVKEWGSVSFLGEDDVRVALPGGPATAVNLMTGRSHEGVMRVSPVGGALTLSAETVAVLVLRGSAGTSRGDVLQPMDFLVCGRDAETLVFTKAIALFVDVRRR